MGYARGLGVWLVIFFSALGLPMPAAAQALTPPIGASAQLIDAGGRLVAEVEFRQATDQVLISLSFADRAALVGTHAVQIHEVGRCDPPDFTSAGGIFNPFGKEHGLRNPNGPMAGDVPSLVIGPGGVSGYNTAAQLVKLGPDPASLFGQAGTSVVVFAQADDNESQPEGNAGARIACGVIYQQAPDSPRSVRTILAGGQRPVTGDPDLLTALLIAVLGALMIAAGVVLRRMPRVGG